MFACTAQLTGKVVVGLALISVKNELQYKTSHQNVTKGNMERNFDFSYE